MPQFPVLSKMDLVFPGFSSTGKIVKKITRFSRISGMLWTLSIVDTPTMHRLLGIWALE